MKTVRGASETSVESSAQSTDHTDNFTPWYEVEFWRTAVMLSMQFSFNYGYVSFVADEQ